MLRSIVLVLALCGCAPASPMPSVPAVRERTWILGAGDVIRIDAYADATITGTYVLDASGAIELQPCGNVALAGIAEPEVTTVIRRCLVAANAYADASHVHAHVLHRNAHVIVRRSDQDAACLVQLDGGLTVVQALSAAIGSGQGRGTARVTLRRAGVDREIDLGAVLAGEQRDEPLVPGDEILLPGHRTMTCMTKAMESPRASPPDPESAAPTATTCGALMLAEAELVAGGKGEKHPEVIATARAREIRCAEEPSADSLREACTATRQRQAELSMRYGPAHPTMVGLAAALALCDAKLGPVATEPSPARHIGVDASAGECPLHLNGPVPDASVNEWLGWTARLLHLCQGEPDERSEERWIYRLPDGCSEIRSEITVVFAKGVVISAKVKNRHTGAHCDF